MKICWFRRFSHAAPQNEQQRCKWSLRREGTHANILHVMAFLGMCKPPWTDNVPNEGVECVPLAFIYLSGYCKQWIGSHQISKRIISLIHFHRNYNGFRNNCCAVFVNENDELRGIHWIGYNLLKELVAIQHRSKWRPFEKFIHNAAFYRHRSRE